MADTSPMIQQGVELVQRATVEDEAGHLEAALKLYLLGIEAFMTVLKRERNESVKRTLFLKLQSYLSRAEQLKKQLRTAAAPSPSPPLSLPEVPSFPSPPTVSLIDDTPLPLPSPPTTLRPSPNPNLSISSNSPSNPNSQNKPSFNFPSLPPPDDADLSWETLLASAEESEPRAAPGADEVRLEGETGHSFDSLYGAYALGASRVTVHEKAGASAELWVHFAEFVASSGVTALHARMVAPADQAGVELALLALQSSLSAHGVALTYEWGAVAAPKIEFEGTGVTVEGKDGVVDLFAAPQSEHMLGAHNLQFRATKQRTLTVRIK